MDNDRPAISTNFWTTEGYVQRMSEKDWKTILLDGGDITPIIRGRLRKFVGKSLGFGVVEVRLVPLEKENDRQA